jgi:choline dehydrogenase-like flavoprotein
MRFEASEITAGSVVEADICIAGGGAAGITLARQLSRGKHSVLLLEGGGFRRESESQDLYRGQADRPLADTYMHGSRLRYLGGTTNHWLGFCRPLDEVDFASRPWVPHSGWPFSGETLEPYYRRAAEVCQVRFAFPPMKFVAESGGTVGAIYYQANPLRFRKAYREDLEHATTLRLVLHANLLHIQLDEHGRQVDHLVVAASPGHRFRVRARAFVLALGGIENPRMLLLSNDRQGSGVGNTHDLVGRFFMDHPVYPVATVCVSGGGGLFTTLPSDAPSPYPGYALSQDEQQRRQILNCSLAFGLVPEVEDTRHQLLSEGAWEILEPYLEERSWKPPQKPLQRSGEKNPLFLTRFDIRPECTPDPENRVTLGDALDAFSQRKPRLRWQAGELEVATVRQSFEALARTAGAAGLGRLRLDPAHPLDVGYSPGFHHMGTTRMSDDPRQGVVNRDARVHGIQNLFIAGSSVFPTSGYANPTYTIVALTLRLADYLEKELAS